MEQPDQHQTFWDHLDALRGVLLKIAALTAVLGVVSFCYMPEIFEAVVMAPCRPDFPFYRLIDAMPGTELFGLAPAEEFSLQLVSLELASQFYIHLSASCWTALIIGFPVIIYLLWTFVAPGLHEHEKRGMKRAFLVGNLMFFAGVAVGYFVVFPLTLRFLATYRISPNVIPTISLDSYMDNFFTLILVMGAVFELPLLAWLAGKAGIIDRRFFSRFRRHAIVVLLIGAALITPTGDPFTLFAVFIPIYALWELGCLLVPSAPANSDS